MIKKYSTLLSTLFILGILSFMYYSILPREKSEYNKPFSQFSTERALNHIKNITQEPHYVGSENHETVANYLISELTKMGLEVKTEEGFTLSDWGNLTKSKNIITRIKGSDNSKALLLLSHYDSAPHSYSHGASDDASGLATILEGVRTFLYNKTPHKNDIIILFTDAEELGLNGAALFATKNNWAKEIGLALNFEARGTAGPSYMLMEVPAGNEAMVKDFAKANVKFPVTNSLMYSVYKMLPNDTDLTVLKQQSNIPGFNFAFIDNHFNYHTAQDDVEHLDINSLNHQRDYLMPLLHHFANSDLQNLKSTNDYVYFSIPYLFINYSFNWIFPLLLVAIALFTGFIIIGLANKMLIWAEIKRGFRKFLGSLIIAGAITFLIWKILLLINPEYNEILQGFTYNGHDYIAAFIFLSLGIAFFMYRKINFETKSVNYFAAPLFVWIILNGILAFILPGAGFFIIPVYFGLILFGISILKQKNNLYYNLLLSIPALLIYAPFVVMFPIGLGLKILAGSSILTILIFGLLLPILGAFQRKKLWTSVMMTFFILFLIKAQLHADFEKGEAKPNSLVYILDKDLNKAFWTTYDNNLDSWTNSYIGNEEKPAESLNLLPLFSKYNSVFTFMNDAPLKNISEPTIEIKKDSISEMWRHIEIAIKPNRNVNRYDIFANENMVFYNLKANGATALEQKTAVYERKGKKILSYYVVNNEPLNLKFSIKANQKIDMDLMESSFDLMTHKDFDIKKREEYMMPKPFVLNDAVVIKQHIDYQ